MNLPQWGMGNNCGGKKEYPSPKDRYSIINKRMTVFFNIH